jgi:hypothetical protein
VVIVMHVLVHPSPWEGASGARSVACRVFPTAGVAGCVYPPASGNQTHGIQPIFFFCGKGPRSRSYGHTAALRLIVLPSDEN